MGIFSDKLQGFLDYFELNDSEAYEEQEEAAYELPNTAPTMRVVNATPSTSEPAERRRTSRPQVQAEKVSPRNQRQERNVLDGVSVDQRAVIDIKFPKKYEDAPEIVQLLVSNASVLIDFQHMSETQARRCLDYLDGARSVLMGNMRKVSSTMWLLTPANVTVNMDELRSAHAETKQDSRFDFDMRR